MFRRNPGRFTETVKLMKPSAPKRDALGGVSATTYTEFLKMRALVTVKSQSKQQIIGDYVTVDTRYFLVRDTRKTCPDLDSTWRLEWGGKAYKINDVLLIDESRPAYVQITATAITGGGKL